MRTIQTCGLRFIEHWQFVINQDSLLTNKPFCFDSSDCDGRSDCGSYRHELSPPRTRKGRWLVEFELILGVWAEADDYDCIVFWVDALVVSRICSSARASRRLAGHARNRAGQAAHHPEGVGRAGQNAGSRVLQHRSDTIHCRLIRFHWKERTSSSRCR